MGIDVAAVLGAIAAVVLALIGWNSKTKRDTKKATKAEAEADAVKEYATTRKEMDNARPVDTNASSARDRLRDRQAKRDRSSDR